ncbi:MAG: hypothetical protein ACLQMH_04170 [Solirubrobacteraceae bacterium]
MSFIVLNLLSPSVPARCVRASHERVVLELSIDAGGVSGHRTVRAIHRLRVAAALQR